MKSYSSPMRSVPTLPTQTKQQLDVPFWLIKATGLLVISMAVLAMMALTGCKDAGKAGASGGGAGAGSPPLSAPPSSPPSPPPEAPAAGGGMTAPPGGAASAADGTAPKK